MKSIMEVSLKIKLFTLFFLILLLWSGCEKNTADMVIQNGKIYTVNEFNPLVEAVAVKGGKIIALGSQEDVSQWIGDQTKIINLNGGTMIPGLIEGHGHFMGLGFAKMRLDLTTISNYDELVSMVDSAVGRSEPGEWILGRGWHQSKWTSTPSPAVKGFQTHEKLSAVSPNNPVWLTHASGHAGFANAKAMEISGISAESQFGEGGEIIKNLKGTPTGIFNERAQGLISRNVPATGSGHAEKAFELAVQASLESGITSFQDAGSGRSTIALFRNGLNSGKLKVRLYVMLSSQDPDLLEEWYKKGPEIGTGNDYLTIRSIKLNADGALGSRGAWLLDEYTDRPGHVGMATQPMDYVYDVSSNGFANGFQVNTHAIGDRANQEVLDQYETVFNENPGIDHRWRIEHAQHIDPKDIPRFAEMGVIASIQAIHLSSDRPWA
ncbi:MAG: amidohydrolase, partial [Candidatus Marinimicrobia bacterium]|nr:amidohydrolase [Candidatus Neomarinimicrobiota bacterium]